ncbi:SDR family NAD(P)-dependent oxidoreductase [Loigolactobacillus binensis]|uniref:SDR family NAD(P)-dependent oxidoreductase n=1 Tax=Loigolactobacillus binensis TaxID=2559922 RepID=A0ABW3EAQ2_9LACO|nr:SDR family NAD(P)-dependent oxidoreductase [Loigolactobacillus binensis]
MKTIVIVGAGPGLGLSLAKKFGTQGFQVALLSLHERTLNNLSTQLDQLKIKNKTYVVDVTDLAALATTLTQVIRDHGTIDVIEFSPYAGPQYFRNVLTMTQAEVQQQLQFTLFPVIRLVQSVLPNMQAQGHGAILINSGITSVYPLPQLGNTGIACAALRNYAQNLHNVLQPAGIYVGLLSVAAAIKKGTAGDPDLIAAKWYDLFVQQNQFEAIYPEIPQHVD